MFQLLTGHKEDFHHQVRKSNTMSVYEYYVIEMGYDENMKIKPFNIAEHRQGKLLNRTPTYKDTFLHNLSNHPKEYNLAACTGDGEK